MFKIISLVSVSHLKYLIQFVRCLFLSSNVWITKQKHVIIFKCTCTCSILYIHCTCMYLSRPVIMTLEVGCWDIHDYAYIHKLLYYILIMVNAQLWDIRVHTASQSFPIVVVYWVQCCYREQRQWDGLEQQSLESECGVWSCATIHKYVLWQSVINSLLVLWELPVQLLTNADCWVEFSVP